MAFRFEFVVLVVVACYISNPLFFVDGAVSQGAEGEYRKDYIRSKSH
jgi:hypothetical protein